MDKVEQLEKRIEQLESVIEEQKEKEKRSNLFDKADSFLEELVTREEDTYQTTFLNKYTKDNLPEDSKQLCIKEAINGMRQQWNSAKKLDYWKKYKKKLNSPYKRDNVHWHALQYFVNRVIQYYETRVIQDILKDAKFIDMGGPREQKEVKEKGYRIFSELKNEKYSKFFHQNGRHKGGPKWDKIEPILRKRLGKEFGSIRSIKDYIREQEK